jgi:hypothetical protein
MKRISFVLLLGLMCLYPAFTQFNYVQVTNGLTDLYESGNTIIKLGDIDKDGDVDIISVGDHYSPLIAEEHGIMVFQNNGNGTSWTKVMNGDFGYGGVAMGDVNNDGFWDLAYVVHHNYSSTDFGDQILEVVLGDGSGTNWVPYDDNLGLQGQTWGMFGCDFADVDNDGLLDLGANSFGCCDGVWIYKNNGNGTWATMGGALNSTDNSNFQFRFGDFNRDGKPDFIVNNTRFNNQTYQVWQNTGNGIFIPMTTGLPFSGAWGDWQFKMDVADINNDGAADIAISLGGYARVYIYDIVNNTWMNFSNGLPTTSQNLLNLALGDLDSDGFFDLMTFMSGLITIYKGDGTGNWVQAATLTVPENTCYDLKLNDLDHNGYPDIVYWGKHPAVPDDVNMLRVYLNTMTTTEMSIWPVFPIGGEFFCNGSAQFIIWNSSVPQGVTATVSIGYSSTGPTGPFTDIVNNAPNSGLYQWNIPGLSSTSCYLRFKINNGTVISTTTMNAPFGIDICGNPPVIPGPVVGDTAVCSGAMQTYSVPITPTATGYVWTLPVGWTGSSITNTISTVVGTASGNVTVFANSPTGNSLPVSMYVSVTSIDTSVTQIGPALTASETGASYQWIDCNSGNDIPGATDQSYDPTGSSGSYAVIIYVGSCSDTSGCHSLCTTPDTPGPVSGNATICQGSSNTYSIAAVSGATSYTWTLPSGWAGYSTATSINAIAGSTGGNITVSANNGPACSSLPQTFAVTVISVDTAVSVNMNTLTAHATGATYQWIDCISGNEIPGETNLDYTPTSDGSYAVIITINGCTDTSSCHNFTLGIVENSWRATFTINPNPTNGKIVLNGSITVDEIEIYNLLGECIYKSAILRPKTEIDISSQRSGIYILQVRTKEGIISKKIVKQ